MNSDISGTATSFDDSYATPLVESSRWWHRLENWCLSCSDWLNPILVKEARQALKSRQFVITFTLLLICGCGWSLLGVAMLSPGVYYAPGGRFMLTGYFIVLVVPMIVIVPFTAFRSLASEREDGTFELLSITSLKSRQIVTGKLGSAVIQMMVYYSALAPCIAFTYLLRGVDVVIIGMLLIYTFLASVLLSSVGLVMATATRVRHWQGLLSVLLLMVLLLIGLGWGIGFANLIFEASSPPVDEIEFWIVQVAIISFYVTFVALFVTCAAAQISFASDNRATRLRIVMFIQNVMWIGWMVYTTTLVEEPEVLYVMIFIGAIYWFLMGSLMQGENPQLSPRVKRSLPQTMLGRMLFTWFNPGAGAGYVFAVFNMWTIVVVAVIAALIGNAAGKLDQRATLETATIGLLAAAYLTVYLGIGRFVIELLRRVSNVGLLLPTLINILLAALGAGIPTFTAALYYGYSSFDYSIWQLTNWAWTFERYETIWSIPGLPLVPNSGPQGLRIPIPVLVMSAAVVSMIFHFITAIREVEQTRAVTPQRVLEDDLLNKPSVPQDTMKNPWDDGAQEISE